MREFKIKKSYILASKSIVLTLVACLIYYLAYGNNIINGVPYDDFPAFYTGAVMAWEGVCGSLYNLTEQIRVQDAIFPVSASHFHVFPYPAIVAVLLSPLSMLPPLIAYLIFLSLMLAFLLGGIHMLVRVKGYQSKLRIIMFAYVFSSAPGFCGWAIAQVSFYVFFCFAMFIASGLCLLYEKQSCERELLAKVGLGLALGGLLLKPQFAVVPAAYCFFSRQWFALFVFVCIGCLFYVIGAWSCGVLWPIDWLSFIADYNVDDHVKYWRGSVSLLVTIEHYLALAGFKVPSFFLPCASLACLLFVLVFWMKTWSSSKEWRLFSIPVLAVLLSPHSMKYDAIMFLFPLLYHSDRCKTSKLIIVLIICQSVGMFELSHYGGYVPVNMLMLMGCAMLFNLSGNHRNARWSLIS